MRMVDIQLTLPGIIAQKIIDDNEDHISIERQEKIRDYAASVNTGPSGRFQKEVLLDLDEVLALKKKQDHLTVQASFTENGTGINIMMQLVNI
jgi:hypothetical protein